MGLMLGISGNIIDRISDFVVQTYVNQFCTVHVYIGKYKETTI